MNHVGLFLAGIGVTLIVGASMALLIWGAILDGREEAKQRQLREAPSVHPYPVPSIDHGAAPDRAA